MKVNSKKNYDRLRPTKNKQIFFLIYITMIGISQFCFQNYHDVSGHFTNQLHTIKNGMPSVFITGYEQTLKQSILIQELSNESGHCVVRSQCLKNQNFTSIN